MNCPRGAREAALGRRPLPGGGGTQRPGWAVKRRSRPLPRDESACFRGATHVQSGIPLPLSFCCGKGTTPVSGPAGKAVSRPPAADAFSRRRPSLLRRCGRYLPRQGGFCSTILPQSAARRRRTGAGDGTSYGSGGKGLGFGVDDIAPVQVPPLQAVDENLRRGHIGGEGDVVLVAEGGDILQIRVQIVGLGV